MSDPQNPPRRRGFDPATILFHWLTVALIGFLGASGLVFALEEPPPPALLWLHRSAGMLLWALTLLRLLWRSTFARLPPFPENLWGVQRAWIVLSERALYLLLLVQPLSGLATTLLLGRPFVVFNYEVPALLPRNLALWQVGFVVHRDGAIALFALVGLHAGIVLLRHYFLRSDVLIRMAPWASPRAFDRGRA